MNESNFDPKYTISPWLAVTGIVLICGLLVLTGCAADGTIASGSKPLDKNQTRLAMCEGAQKIDIAFQTIAKNTPGVIPANVMDAEGAVIDTVGFTPGSPDAARAGSVCATVYSGNLDVAINTAIVAITNVSGLIKNWQK